MIRTSHRDGGGAYLLLDGSRPMTGDLDLAGNDLLTTNLRIRERTANAFEITARAAATWRHLYLNTLYLNSMISNVTIGQFRCRTVATSVFNFDCWNGAAHVTVLQIGSNAVPKLRVPNIPIADPADGLNSLWSNGGVVTVGT